MFMFLTNTNVIITYTEWLELTASWKVYGPRGKRRFCLTVNANTPRLILTPFLHISILICLWLSDDDRCGLITYQHDLTEALLPLERQTRVVGGEPAAAWSSPWQMALRSRMYGHLCGGALISSTWLLTAAHCVTRCVICTFTRIYSVKAYSKTKSS